METKKVMSDASCYVKENYSILYEHRRTQIEALADLRGFGSVWAQESAPGWDTDQKWTEIVRELDLIIESGHVSDRDLLERLLCYVNEPTAEHYYAIEELASFLPAWAKSYLMLSYVLFDGPEALMFFAESDHPFLYRILDRLPFWSKEKISYRSICLPIGRERFMQREKTIEEEKEALSSEDDRLEDERESYRQKKRSKQEWRTYPESWSRLLLAQYAQTQQTTFMILDGVPNELLSTASLRLPVGNEWVLSFYERTVIFEEQLLDHSLTVGYLPVIMRNFREAMKTNYEDQYNLHRLLRGILIKPALLIHCRRILESFQQDKELKEDFRTAIWKAIIDQLSERPPLDRVKCLATIFPLPEQLRSLTSYNTRSLLYDISSDDFLAYRSFGFLLASRNDETHGYEYTNQTLLSYALSNTALDIKKLIIESWDPQDAIITVTDYCAETACLMPEDDNYVLEIFQHAVKIHGNPELIATAERILQKSMVGRMMNILNKRPVLPTSQETK